MENKEKEELSYVLLVGLNDAETKKQEITTLDAFKIASNIIVNITGGGTITEARGVYTHQNGTIVVENSLKIEISGATDAQIHTIIDLLKQALHQDEILLQKIKLYQKFI